jgi:AcrR family transcriptional regulator
MMRKLPKAHHPTKAKLIATVVELMQSENPELVNVEHVLEISGISRGSLYHHFEDFSELLEAAQIDIFSIYVDLTVEKIGAVVQNAKSREDFIQGIKKVTRATQNPQLTTMRAQRIGAIALATGNERFKKALGLEQERLTDSIADLFREGQEKNLAESFFDPRVAAVFIQAYTLGRIVDDITPNHVDPDAWNALIDSIVEGVFIPNS